MTSVCSSGKKMARARTGEHPAVLVVRRQSLVSGILAQAVEHDCLISLLLAGATVLPRIK